MNSVALTRADAPSDQGELPKSLGYGDLHFENAQGRTLLLELTGNTEDRDAFAPIIEVANARDAFETRAEKEATGCPRRRSRTTELAVPTVLIQAAAGPSDDAYQSASAGAIQGDQLGLRPLARTADLLEAVPGLSVTQHSSDGKANQYFLLRSNLDHGCDF